jgi:hypothetical protein
MTSDALMSAGLVADLEAQLLDGLHRDRRRDDRAAADGDLDMYSRDAGDDLHHFSLEYVARAEPHVDPPAFMTAQVLAGA